MALKVSNHDQHDLKKSDFDVSFAKPVESTERLVEPSDAVHVDQVKEHAPQAFPEQQSEVAGPESTSESTKFSSQPEESIAGPEIPEASLNELTIQELRDGLERLNKTQTELADALGVTRFYVSKILSGSKPFTPELQSKSRQVLAAWNVDASDR